jgi:hypothetical protein
MAPEMININGFNHVMNQKSHKLFSSNGYNGAQTDIFALGVVLFSLYMGRPPFKLADINDPFYRLIFTHQTDEFWAPWDQFASQNNFEIPDNFKNLFIGCVTFSPLLRLSINEILGSKWMLQSMPINTEVAEYMSAIKKQIDDLENEQMAFYDSAAKVEAKENKESSKLKSNSNDELNDSSLSGDSLFKDDDEMIMKDLQDIEKKFYENGEMSGIDSLNLGEYEIDFDELSNAEDVDLDKMDEVEMVIESRQPEQEEIIHTSSTNSKNEQATQILQFLDSMTEVDTEVRTTVPTKMLSFLEQYAKLKNWKLVKIFNYVLLKIPDSSGEIVEYALKFDQVDESKYALKYLKYDEMSFEQFHSVGSFILDLISPY